MIGYKNIEIQNLAAEIGYDLSEYEKIYKERIKKVLEKVRKKEMIKTFMIFPIMFFILLLLTMFFILIINRSIAGFFLVFMISFLINTLGSVTIGIGLLLLKLEKVIKEILSIAGDVIEIGAKKIEIEDDIEIKIILEQIIALIIIPEIGNAIKRIFSYMGILANKKIEKHLRKIVDNFFGLIEPDKIKSYIKYIKDYKLDEYEEVLSSEISSIYIKIGRFISRFVSGRLIKVDWWNLFKAERFHKKIKIAEGKESFKTHINKIKLKAVGSLKNLRNKVFFVGVFFILIEIVQVVLLFIVLNQ